MSSPDVWVAPTEQDQRSELEELRAALVLAEQALRDVSKELASARHDLELYRADLLEAEEAQRLRAGTGRES